MKEQVAKFVAYLQESGMSREQIAYRAYDYALALQTDQFPSESGEYLPSTAMLTAAELVRGAMPLVVHYSSRVY
jgi:hypothetical protein